MLVSRVSSGRTRPARNMQHSNALASAEKEKGKKSLLPYPTQEELDSAFGSAASGTQSGGAGATERSGPRSQQAPTICMMNSLQVKTVKKIVKMV
eukprot:6480148-Amphidinium_carterae.1